MLETIEEQTKFYKETIIYCNNCSISSYCKENNYHNNLNITCWNIFQKWLKEKIHINKT